MKFLRFKLTPEQQLDLQMWGIVVLILVVCLIVWFGTMALNDHNAFR